MTTLCRTALASLLVIACASDEEGGDGPGPRPTSSAVIGPDGGVLLVGEAVLAIPPGALASPVRISGRERAAEEIAGVRALSAVFAFEPDGLEFAVPAALMIATPDVGADDEVTIAQVVGEELEPLTSLTTNQGVTTTLAHFSEYVVISLIPSYDCEDACGAYQICCPDDDDVNGCVPLGTQLHCGGCGSCVPPDICCDEPTASPNPWACVDVKADNDKHCGACSNDCARSVLGGPKCCGGLCVDFKTDPKHCGECRHECGSNEACVDGKCVCAPERLCKPYDWQPGDDPYCCQVGQVCHTEPIKGDPCI
jgi:hypothetical protein